MLSLTKIEVYGFKSFADRTVLDFTKDVTAIVGPNGCGKSNVLDTIKWVLGEQSAKTLRGESMRAVIFCGTQARKAMSYCEASLYFDNTNRAFDIDLPEVVFTRKLDKSGESEYQINHQPCLKRDIINLLYDTGVGKDGYSIIGQNKIYEILSAKKDDRRRIFEEAAGISKFKVQKKSTEDNISEANRNIELYETEIKALENRLRPLREQVERKKKYDEAFAELRWFDVNNFLHKTEKSEGDRAKLVQQIVELRSTIEEKSTELADVDKNMSGARYLFAAADSELGDANRELTELKVRNMGVIGKSGETASRLQAARENSERIAGELALNEKSQESFSAQRIACAERRDGLRSDTDNLRAKLDEVDAKKSELQGKIRIEENQALDTSGIDEQYEKLAEIKANLSTYRTLRDLKAHNLVEMREEYPKLRMRFDYENTEASREEEQVQRQTRRKAEAVKDLANAERSKKDGEDTRAALSEITLRDSKSLAVYEGKLENLEQDKKNYNAYGEAVGRLMVDCKTNPEVKYRIVGTVAEVLRVPTQYEIAVDVALGNILQNIVTETDEDAKYLVKYLKQNNYGSATFLPLNVLRPRTLDDRSLPVLQEDGVLGLASELVENDRKFDNMVSNILGNIVVVENIEKAVFLARKYRHQFRIVTLDGNAVMKGGAIFGGSRKSGVSRILTQEKEISTYRAETEKLKNKLATYASGIAECDLSIASCAENISHYMAEISDSHEKAESARVKRDAAQKAAAELADSVEKAEKDVFALETEVNTLTAQIDTIDREESSAKEAQKKQRDETSKNLGALDQMKNDLAKLVTESTDLQVKIAEINRELMALEQELQRLDKELRTAREEHLDLETGKISVDVKIQAYMEEIEKHKLSPEDEKLVAELEVKIAELTESKRVYTENADLLQARHDALLLELGELRLSAQNAENKRDTLDAEMERLTSYISEEYGLDYDGALKLKDEEFVPAGADSRIKTLKREIAALGEINHAALSDFQEVSRDFDEKSALRNDLVETEAALQKVLANLIETMTKQFLEAFETVNKNFGEIFCELFAGGSASLELDFSEEGATALDCGIDIRACPPGKRISDLSSLSGGERSMVAISILFAIMRLKTIPFCVLDEVEQALDETNCRLFAQCLRKFCDRSQFIVITHKKATMELADDLFGVTMEERGVSKVIKVNLSEAIKHAKKDGEE